MATRPAHQDEITLAIGDHEVALIKSDRLVGIRPRSGVDRGVVVELTGVDEEARLGGFDVVDVASVDQPVEQTLDELRDSPAVEAGTHVYQTSADGVPFVPTGELYVEFTDAATPEQSTALLAENRLEIVEPRGERALLVKVTPASPNPLKCAAALQASELVDVAEPELATPGSLAAFALPTDPRVTEQWHLRNTGRHRGTSIGLLAGADARVLDAWQRAESLGSPSVVVAVIDDGFDLDHPDLAGSAKIVAPWDFQRGADRPVPDPAREDWHGTACAGVAVGNADGTGIVGVAPGCRLMPVRMVPILTGRNIESWFDHVGTSGAWVVSCSWGALAAVFPLPTLARRAIARCATEGRGGRGVVVCFAAGNDRRDVNGPNSLNGFAVHPDVLAVAASNSLDTASDYSNFGAEIAVCAPSSGAPGMGVATADVTGRFVAAGGVQREAGYSPGPYTPTFGGTSSACPLVAGVCALVLSVRPELTAAEVRAVVRDTARPIGDPVDENGHHPRFGFGCVDADAAVAAVLDATVPGAVKAAEPAVFHPPGLVDDFAQSPTSTAAFAAGWDAVVDSWLTEAADKYGTAAAPSLFYNPRADGTPGEPARQRITWAAFPLFLDTWFADEDDVDELRWTAAETLRASPEELRAVVDGALGDPVVLLFRPQDEYCEWFVHRDAAGNVTRVDLTSEGPEYWRFLAHGTRDFFEPGDPRADLVAGNLDLVVELYRRHVDPAVTREDITWPHDVAVRTPKGWALFALKGDYNPNNRWNTTHGAMHLTHPANTLFAEVHLAGGATVPRRGPGGVDVFDAEDLIACSAYGEPNRSSDPSIGAGVNALARTGLSVSLADPVGLYISSINLDAFAAPGGADPTVAWHVDRGDAATGMILRARLEVPPGAGFTVADLTARGVPIRHGGQIVDHMQMVLTGLAKNLGTGAVPRRACVAKACTHPTRAGIRRIVRLSTNCASLSAQNWDDLAPFTERVAVAAPPPGTAAEPERVVFSDATPVGRTVTSLRTAHR